MSFYLFIAISFLLNIVCKNIVCELGLKMVKISKYFFCKVVSRYSSYQISDVEEEKATDNTEKVLGPPENINIHLSVGV